MKLRHTSFCDIICRNAASASCSLIAGGSASGFAARIPAGIVAWTSASSVGWPRAASMARTSSSEGPTWRGTNVSGAGSGVTAELLEMRAGHTSDGRIRLKIPACSQGCDPGGRGPNARAPAPSVGPAPGSAAPSRAAHLLRVKRSILRRGVGLAFDLLLPVIHGEEQPHARPLLLLVLRRHRQAEPVLLRLERHAIVDAPGVVERVTHHRERIAATVRERHLDHVRRALDLDLDRLARGHERVRHGGDEVRRS